MVIKGRNTIGYIVDESATQWFIELGTHRVRKVRRPVYVMDFHTYNFCQREACITEYWPVRFKISTSGECTYYTINRVCFTLNTNKVMFQYST